MGRSTTITCDSCKKTRCCSEINPGRWWRLEIAAGMTIDWEQKSWDFCCKDCVADWVEKGRKKEKVA